MSLWQHRDFLKLWIGQTISEVGSRITREGLPMGAVLMMGITPISMSALSLATQLPAAFLGLFIGVWVDRLRRRPLLVSADLLRALLLLIIPVAALLHQLHLWMFFLVAGLSGILSLLFDVSYQAYLPWLIHRDNLVGGNRLLGITSSTAEVVGPGLTGILVQLLTAPFAILFDAVSYVFSAVSLLSIGKREGALRFSRGVAERGPERLAEHEIGANPGFQGETVQGQIANWREEVAEGFRAIKRSRILIALASVAITGGFVSSAMFILDTLYALRTLGLSPLLFGLTVTMGGVGSLIGAAISERVVKRFGLGKTLVVTLFLQGVGAMFWLVAGGSVWRSTLCLFAAQLLGDTSGMIYGIFDTTLRQSLTSDELLGRVNATIRAFEVGLYAIGSITSGVLGQAIGIRHTMAFAATGMLLTTLWLVFSPVRRLRTISDALHPGREVV